jgi:GT2 family glycosyltransferase
LPPLISIVLPNWNTKAHIIDFLDSVALQIYPKSALEVIIADNGSSDGSQEAIRQWYSRHMDEGWHRLELIELNENCGIAFAYNTAYHDCSPESEAILRGESDVIWDINLVNVLTKALFSRPDAGVVGARGVNFNSPDRIDHAARYINWWTGHLSDRDPETLVVCDCVFGGTFLIRRSSLDRMGFFFHIDRFLASELDLCTRIKKLD